MTPLVHEVPYRVGLFGEFSAGKSTLVNSVVGRDVQRTAIEPTTDRVTILARSVQERLPRVATVILDDVPLLQWGLQLWDTPGWNGDDDAHGEEAGWASKMVDEALYVIDATKGIHRSDVENVQRLRAALEARGRPPPSVALGHYDRVTFESEEEEQELLGDASRDLGLPVPAILRLDARRLDEFDGPRLIERWARESRQRVATALHKAVARSVQHPLRQVIARGGTWQPLVPLEIILPTTATLLAEWDSHCRTQDERLRRAQRTAVYKYPAFSLTQSRQAVQSMHARWNASSVGWEAGRQVRVCIAEIEEWLRHEAITALTDPERQRMAVATMAWLGIFGVFGAGTAFIVGAGTGGWGLVIAIPLLLLYLAAAAVVVGVIGAVYATLAVIPVLTVAVRLFLVGVGYVLHGCAQVALAGAACAVLTTRVLHAPFDVRQIGRMRAQAYRAWEEDVGLADRSMAGGRVPSGAAKGPRAREQRAPERPQLAIRGRRGPCPAPSWAERPPERPPLAMDWALTLGGAATLLYAGVVVARSL